MQASYFFHSRAYAESTLVPDEIFVLAEVGLHFGP